MNGKALRKWIMRTKPGLNVFNVRPIKKANQPRMYRVRVRCSVIERLELINLRCPLLSFGNKNVCLGRAE